MTIYRTPHPKDKPSFWERMRNVIWEVWQRTQTWRYQPRTWHFEHAVMASVLFAVWWFSGRQRVEITGSFAVYFSFGHASVGERLREQEAARPVASVECHEWLQRYYIGKEVLWFWYFWEKQAFPALVGCVAFMILPFWRKYWRSIHPMTQK